MLACIFQVLLFLWFLGAITTYGTSRWILVEGMGIKSAEFGMMCFYVAGVILFYCFNTVGKWFLLAVLLLWTVVQFFCHWYYTIFGASENKIKGYNECFRNCIHLIPASETRLIPDFYHIVLHILLLSNLILLICSMVK